MNEKNDTAHRIITNSGLSSEPWKVFQIVVEFIEGYGKLAAAQPLVSMFGSSKAGGGHKYCEPGEKTTRLVSGSGFSVVSGAVK